jgi:DNA-binding NtrC family response regulator
MAAAYGIVKNHNGWIFVDSELGVGTTVSIYLPALKFEKKETIKEKLEPVKGTGTILIVEDEQDVMDISRTMIESLGYQVLGAMTGKEAITIAKGFDSDIDLVLLDLVLPDTSGRDIYHKLVKIRPNIKVIICSGYSIDGTAQEILDAGAHDFIQKPFSLSTVSEKLNRILKDT